jgi:hypothetical protein
MQGNRMAIMKLRVDVIWTKHIKRAGTKREKMEYWSNGEIQETDFLYESRVQYPEYRGRDFESQIF